MNRELKILGEVQKGIYHSFDNTLNCTGSAMFGFENQIIEVIVKKYKEFKQRTSQQNKYYHGVVIPHQISAIQETWGEVWTAGQVKQYDKEKFGIINFTHGDIVVYKSTAEYTVEELMIFIDNIRDHFAVDFGYYIPSPEDLIRGK